jgi:hypothetical protein
MSTSSLDCRILQGRDSLKFIFHQSLYSVYNTEHSILLKNDQTNQLLNEWRKPHAEYSRSVFTPTQSQLRPRTGSQEVTAQPLLPTVGLTHLLVGYFALENLLWGSCAHTTVGCAVVSPVQLRTSLKVQS